MKSTKPRIKKPRTRSIGEIVTLTSLAWRREGVRGGRKGGREGGIGREGGREGGRGKDVRLTQ